MNMMSPIPGDPSNIYLSSYLAPFAQWLDADDVTEILVNRPQEVWVERLGTAQMERHDAPLIDAACASNRPDQPSRCQP
jgi:type IV secretion system protein VirB11